LCNGSQCLESGGFGHQAQLDRYSAGSGWLPWSRHCANEYARGNVHTNTIEGFFSLLKRGLIGTYHHVGEQHLQRYVREFDFRYNYREKLGFDDKARSDAALKGIRGKRLTYRRTDEQQASV
jgi:hypothetical protein